MREILFRGKRKDNGEWIKGSFWDEIPGELGAIAHYGSCIFHHVDLETVGQFTGLTDKNGKKIFEGDVLRNHYFAQPDEEWDEMRVVEMVGGAWVATDVEDGTLSVEYASDNLLLYSSSDSEIIGNIHDNPELLGNGGI